MRPDHLRQVQLQPRLQDPAARMISFFDLVADGYDEWAGGVRRTIAARLVKLADPGAGEVCLDVGTGTGLVALELARAVVPGTVVAIDLSRTMLERVEVSADEDGLDNVEPMVMAAENLWFRAGYFDLVTICDTLSYLEDPEKALDEATRVLKPGGRLAIASPRRSLDTAAQDVFFRMMTDLATRHSYLKVPGYEGTRPRYGEPDVIEPKLRSLGLTDLRTTTFVTGHRAPDADTFFNLMSGAGPRPHILVRTLGPELRRRLAAAIEPEVQRGGEEGWTYHHAFTFVLARKPGNPAG